MSLTRLSVYRPVVTLAIAIVVVLLGIASYSGLSLEQNPQLRLPIVTAQITFPGASARTVEEQVTRRIEDAVAGLGDVKTITSTSRPGVAAITVEFREGVDVDSALSDVQRRVSAVRRDLPSEAEEPSYAKLDFNDVPVVFLALTSDGRADATRLFRVADELVRPRVESATGVGRVELVGGREPEVQVELLPDRLRAYGLSISDLANAVRNQFLSVSGGDVKSGVGQRTRQTTLRVDSRAAEVAALATLPVTRPDGASTELGNVADVRLGGKEPEEIVRVNGRLAVGLQVYKQASANITETVDNVLPLVDRVNAELPAGYRVAVAVDEAKAIRQSVRGVQDELVLAALITGLVLFFFLHSLRATIIVLLSIPACFLIALITMRVAGLTLNTMTLIGLTTSIGVLVDDSIVVLENIFSHIERRAEPKQAAVDGRSEIGAAAIAITLVDVAVWGPILFVSGVTGAFLRNFAIVLVATTLASLLVSFTLTPLFASRWLASADDRSWLARVAARWEPLYRGLEHGYRRLLHWSLRHRPVVLIVAALVLAGNGLILPRLQSEFVPETNREAAVVVGELPPGTALEATERAAGRWEAALREGGRFPEVQTTYVVAGRSDSEKQARFISMTLAVGEPRSRVRTSSQVGVAAAQLGESVVPGLRARLGGARSGGRGQPVQIRVFGDDLDELALAARRAEVRLAALSALASVTNSLVAAPETVVKPDPSRLKDLGLDTRTVGSALRVAYQGAVVGRWAEPSGRERDVRLRLPDDMRDDPAAVSTLPLVRRGDQMLSVQQVATESPGSTPSAINRVNRQRIALLGAEPNAVPLGTASRAATSAMNGLNLPPGGRWEFAGQSDSQQDSFRQLAVGLAISILLMYLVLTVLYESAIYPLLVLTALPLATIGAFLGLLAFDKTLSVPSFIALIALFGLVGKNSILLVDRTNDLRRRGLDRLAALEEAGPSRLRPILMTSVVLVLSMLPVALNLGDGGELRAPLGAVLVGGMSTSTLLSLLFVPVAYTYFDSLQTLIARVFGWRPRLGRRRRRQAAASGGLEPAVVRVPVDDAAG